MGDNNEASANSKLSLIPSTIKDVTAEWLSNVLSKKISRDNFEIGSNVQGGTGFLSDMLRISCEEIVQAGGEEKRKSVSVIVKLLPAGVTEFEAQARAVMVSEGLDKTEMKFYTIVLPHLLEILPELGQYMCPFHVGHVVEEPRGSVLILEDLKPLGYRTLSFAQDISMSQLEEAVRFLGKFHFAASAVEHKKGKPLDQLYDFLQWKQPEEGTAPSGLYLLSAEGLAKLDTFFEEQKLPQEMRDAYARITCKSDAIIPKVYGAQIKYPTLIHGDLWSNNILYHETNERPMIAIDWQLLGYADSCADLIVLILSSIPRAQLDRDNVDRLIRFYYDTFTGLCKDHGLEVLIRRDFQAFYDFCYTYGCGFGLFWFTFSTEPFASNFPRLIRIYEFLYKDVDLITFLETLV